MFYFHNVRLAEEIANGKLDWGYFPGQDREFQSRVRSLRNILHYRFLYLCSIVTIFIFVIFLAWVSYISGEWSVAMDRERGFPLTMLFVAMFVVPYAFYWFWFRLNGTDKTTYQKLRVLDKDLRRLRNILNLGPRLPQHTTLGGQAKTYLMGCARKIKNLEDQKSITYISRVREDAYQAHAVLLRLNLAKKRFESYMEAVRQESTA